MLLNNMFLLKNLREKYHPDMVVEMFYHIYKHNNKDDFKKMKKLCDELGFTFRYRHAALAPLDNVAAIINNRDVSPEARKAMEYQILPVEEAMAIARTQHDRECFYERCLWITWDMKVSQCMEWYADGKTLVPGSFLDTPLKEISKARNNNNFCDKCKEQSIHRCYTVYGDEKLIHERKSVEV